MILNHNRETPPYASIYQALPSIRSLLALGNIGYVMTCGVYIALKVITSCSLYLVNRHTNSCSAFGWWYIYTKTTTKWMMTNTQPITWGLSNTDIRILINEIYNCHIEISNWYTSTSFSKCKNKLYPIQPACTGLTPCPLARSGSAARHRLLSR